MTDMESYAFRSPISVHCPQKIRANRPRQNLLSHRERKLQTLGNRFEVYDRVHLRAVRPPPQTPPIMRKTLVTSLSSNFNRAVRTVDDPARKSEPPRGNPGKPPESDSLYTTAYAQVRDRHGVSAAT